MAPSRRRRPTPADRPVHARPGSTLRTRERIPPGYGRHPFKVAAIGLLQGAIAGAVLRFVPEGLDALRDTIRDTTEEEIPTALGTGLSVVLAAVLVVAGLVALRAAWMLLYGLVDLVAGRDVVEGRVLRRRQRHLAVDDGTRNRLRAWLLVSPAGAGQGATVRARVTRRLQHVRDYEVVHDAAGQGARATAAATTSSRATSQPDP